MWRVIVSVLCCVMQAAQVADEDTSLFSGATVPKDCLQEQWLAKIQTWLDKKDDVKVFYFPKDGERYSVTYDVTDSTINMSFSFKWRRRSTTVPLTYAFQQEFLLGYILKPGCAAPRITDMDFSLEDACLSDYKREPFFSDVIDSIVVQTFPMLVKMDKHRFDTDGRMLSQRMLQNALPRWRYKRFFWAVVNKSQALRLLFGKKEQPEMFLIVGGVGILWGSLTNCVLCDVSENHRSLFYYKFASNNAVLSSLVAKYPHKRGDGDSARKDKKSQCERTERIMRETSL